MEFAYNNAPSATTSVSLFFANKGYHLNITVHPEHDIASSWVSSSQMVDLVLSILFFIFSFLFLFPFIFYFQNNLG